MATPPFHPKVDSNCTLSRWILRCVPKLFRLFWCFPGLSLVAAMSHLVQTEISTVRRNSIPLPSARSWQLGILGALILWLYWPTLGRLIGQWWNDPNFSHGFFVPLFSAFVIWQEKDRLASILPRPSWWGLVPLVIGLGVLVVGRMGAELFLDRSSLLLVLAGIVIVFAGWTLFRAILFPWAFLLMMIPIPTIVLNQIT